MTKAPTGCRGEGVVPHKPQHRPVGGIRVVGIGPAPCCLEGQVDYLRHQMRVNMAVVAAYHKQVFCSEYKESRFLISSKFDTECKLAIWNDAFYIVGDPFCFCIVNRGFTRGVYIALSAFPGEGIVVAVWVQLALRPAVD